MALTVFANNATLATTSTSGTTAPVAGTTETWSVAALSSLWPILATSQQMTIQDATGGASTNQQSEIILVTACAGAGSTSVSVTRGWENTTPVAHASGSTFVNTITAGTTNNIRPLFENVKTITGSGSALTLVDPTVAQMHWVVLNAAPCVLTFPTPVAGSSITVALVQDSSGSRTVTWPSNVKFPGGTTPTLSTGANKVDLFRFHCFDSTNWLNPGLDVR